MPEFPIVDAHVHLWNPNRFRMSWLDDDPILNKPYGLAEYHQATEGIAVDTMVYLQVEVETPYAFLETKWVVEQAEADPRLQGIVSWAPLEYGERARTYVEALVALDPRVKGIRRIIQYEPNLDFCLQPDFLHGVRILPEYGLSFDVCIDHRHLANATRLVERCPETSFILDHIGKPSIRDRMLDPWRQQIRELASFPNVMCKVSGLVVEADVERWTPADLAPYVEHVLEVFGEDRVAFGGDWPVVLRAASLRRWIDTLDGFTATLPLEARRKLWAENARRFYRLPS